MYLVVIFSYQLVRPNKLSSYDFANCFSSEIDNYSIFTDFVRGSIHFSIITVL